MMIAIRLLKFDSKTWAKFFWHLISLELK